MMNHELMDRLMTTMVLLEKQGWLDEARAVAIAFQRIAELEDFCSSIIWTVDFMPGRMRAKLDSIADEAQSVLYSRASEEAPEEGTMQ